ncbi:hypothetical protein [Deinococcus humi]|uniref:Uncharacterized protein n=1 Tax=Deinococcus humi TaxID=662880 RepID=A0A7W8JVF3_9DEIO|nr:hypothetical protein [Deinococcus humi]MBB5362531.1 hypothetical protein [Deinococcus humi]
MNVGHRDLPALLGQKGRGVPGARAQVQHPARRQMRADELEDESRSPPAQRGIRGSD